MLLVTQVLVGYRKVTEIGTTTSYRVTESTKVPQGAFFGSGKGEILFQTGCLSNVKVMPEKGTWLWLLRERIPTSSKCGGIPPGYASLDLFYGIF